MFEDGMEGLTDILSASKEISARDARDYHELSRLMLNFLVYDKPQYD